MPFAVTPAGAIIPFVASPCAERTARCGDSRSARRREVKAIRQSRRYDRTAVVLPHNTDLLT
jgi:hypothetical protein